MKLIGTLKILAIIAFGIGISATVRADYTVLEYIDSSNSSSDTSGPYVKVTGFSLSAANVVETKVAFTTACDGNGRNDAVFCNRSNSTTGSFTLFRLGKNGPGLRFDYGSGGTTFSSACNAVGTYEIVCSADGCYVGGNKVLGAPGQITTPISNDLLLFTSDQVERCDGNPAFNSGREKMYYFRVRASAEDPTLVLNLIPVRRNSDNALGMYDTVGKTFHQGGGASAFAAGPTKPFFGRLAEDPHRIDASDCVYATGGDIILQDGDYYVHVFTNGADRAFTANTELLAEVLAVGGGGSGGGDCGGGGGAGGLVYAENVALSPNNYTVTVGAGGDGLTTKAIGNSGSDTSFKLGASDMITVAKGGGGGGWWSGTKGSDGGSGGGACGGGKAGVGTEGQGHDGGTGYGGNIGGGGGGAGSIGGAANNLSGGNGGDGLEYGMKFFGWAQYFAGGGGGGTAQNGQSVGGNGGGGKGGCLSAPLDFTSGENGLGAGGGGGGGGGTQGGGGAGGSGVLVIRYLRPGGVTPVTFLSVSVNPASSAYTGSEITPLLTVKRGTETLVSGVAAAAIPADAGFSASWSGTIQNPGTYTLTLAGDGETYIGTKANAATFTVNKIVLPYPKAVRTTTDPTGTVDCPDQENFYDGKSLRHYCDYSGQQQHVSGNYLVWAIIKTDLQSMYCFPNGGTKASFQWTIGTLTPMLEADVPHLTARTFKNDGNAKSVAFANASDNATFDTVAGKGTTSESDVGLYTAYVWPKAGYAWPDGSFEMRPYEWSIVPSNYTDDRNFLQSLANDAHRINASALPPGISGGDLILRYPNYDDGGNVVSHDFVHIYTNTAASGFVFENNSGIPRKGRALIVGGGGAGGSDAGRGGWETPCPTAGGGGGGAVRSVSDLNLIGSFSVKVGVGGTSSQTSGGMSEIAGTGFAYSALGGGRGGTASKSSGEVSNGQNGGSGGGGGGWKLSDTSYGGGTGGQGSFWGYNGAAGGSTGALGGGGGGAGKEASGYNGGYGACSDIIGNELICFGGGGASACLSSNADARYPASGGIGGGGSSSVNQYHRETDFYSRPGVNGLGGGGSAKPFINSGSAQSGERGGDGIVIIRYTDTVRTPDIKTVAIPEVPSFVFNYQLHDTGIRDTDDYTVSDDITGTYIQEYTITLTLRDPDNMQWSDGTSRPQHLPWAIASDNVNQGNASDTFLYGLSTNHNRVAAEPMGVGADVILRSRVTHDNTEYFHYALVYFGSREILASRAFTGDLLLVGGGGGGGGGSYGQSAGGGGAGGVVLFENCGFEGGYFLNVGKGGNGSGDAASGENGENTFISLTQGGDAQSGWIVHGGGGGGGISINGSNGGCGGGAGGTDSGTPYSAGSGIEGEGYSGGVNGTLPFGGGGGGAGRAASGVAAGDGKLVNVLGYDEYFGGGGRGGESAEDQNPGGKGGGGASRPRSVKEGPVVDRIAGKNGQGGGGGGSNHNSNSGNSMPGGRGGDGLIVIAYEIEVGKLLDRPILSSDRLTYSGGVIAATNYLTFAKNMEFSGTVEATDVGTYTFTVAPAEDYHWSDTLDSEPITFTWTIVAKPIQGNVTVDAIANQAYSGSEIRPSFTVRDTARGTTLVAGADYTAEYFANINIGTATIKLTGIGNYTGNEWANFRIVADPNVIGYYVAADADGSGDGTGWTSPFTLQQAFDAISSAAKNAVSIYVKTGTYELASAQTVTSTGKTVNLLGGYLGLNLARSTTEFSVLDGNGSDALLKWTTKDSCTMSRLEFTHGKRAVQCSGVNYEGEFRFETCRFSGNTSNVREEKGAGAALSVDAATSVTVDGCEFLGNYAPQYSAVRFDVCYSAVVKHSVFAGNSTSSSSTAGGAALWVCLAENHSVTIDNCTFAFNGLNATSDNKRYASSVYIVGRGDSYGTATVKNSIFYGAPAGTQASDQSSKYELFVGGNGSGKLKKFTMRNVLFGTVPSGRTDIGTYSVRADEDATDDSTILTGDPLFAVGSPTPAWSSDHYTWSVAPTEMDVHLKSVMGRWNGSAWVNDTVTSPAIDAGDPAADCSDEPAPNGGRVNLGAYGNTAEASKSFEVPEAEAATLSAATGYSEVKQLDNGHTVLIYSNVTDAASFTVAEGGIARILVVGGGGSGGLWAGVNARAGGGGAGGFVESNAVMLVAGTYTVKVGKGGAAVSGVNHQPGDKGGSSSVMLGDMLVLDEALGGGGGAGGDGCPAQSGGSGGGASYGGSAGMGKSGQGNRGGGAYAYKDIGPGGGGAGSVGSTPSDTNKSTNGGDAKLSDITGTLMAYAGGGAGGAMDNGYTTQGGSAGGIKVGGDAKQSGVNGTGSGGGGGYGEYGKGVSGAGGSGIVVVHLFSAWEEPVLTASLAAEASATDPTKATVTLDVAELGQENDLLAVLRWGTTENCTEGAKILNDKQPVDIGTHLDVPLEGLIPGTTYYAKVEFVRADRSVAPIEDAPETNFTTKSVEASAYADISRVIGADRSQTLDDGSLLYVFTETNSATPLSFTLAKGGLARLLVVGGGGAGGFYGYHAATGGGGGGAVIDQVLELESGTYNVTVGAGGVFDDASINSKWSTDNETHYDGNPSSVRLDGASDDVLSALGGGGGGNMDGDGGEGANGGGGSVYHCKPTQFENRLRSGNGGSGKEGFDGGAAWGQAETFTGEPPMHMGGGGGGAGGFGGSVTDENGRGIGGIGLYSTIFDLPEDDDNAWFGGGGAGGAGEGSEDILHTEAVAGGLGGGASSREWSGKNALANPGTPGTGGGGSGVVQHYGNSESKGTANGGNGIVVLRIYGDLCVPVALNQNGGTGGASEVSVSVGQPLPKLGQLPTRSGFMFAGYWSEQTGGTLYYNPDGTSAKDYPATDGPTTLYAHWLEGFEPLAGGKLHFDGTNFILTDYVPVSNSWIETEMQMQGNRTGSGNILFGAFEKVADNPAEIMHYGMTVSKDANNIYGWAMGSEIDGVSPKNGRCWYNTQFSAFTAKWRIQLGYLGFTLSNGSTVLNGRVRDDGKTWNMNNCFPCHTPLAIGGGTGILSSGAGSPGYGTSVCPFGLTSEGLDVYSFKIYESETVTEDAEKTLVHSFVPARSTTEGEGLYDLIGNEFYPLKTQTVVQLDPNGGSQPTNYVYATAGEAMPSPIDVPTRPGYTFQGYATAGGEWTVSKMTGNVTDVINEGETVWALAALNTGWNGYKDDHNLDGNVAYYVPNDITLNGVTFKAAANNRQSASFSSACDGGLSFDPVVAWVDPQDNTSEGLGNTAYGALMHNKMHEAGNSSGKWQLTLNNLAIGQSYCAQIIVHWGNGDRGSVQIGVKPGELYSSCGAEYQYGWSYVLRFTATEGSKTITLYSDGGVVALNAIQLRKVSSVSSSLLYYNADGTSDVTYPVSGGPTTLYAQWEPAKYRVINPETGPEIVVDYEWLKNAFAPDKNKQEYQDYLFTTNASGVVAWQAYVLGYEASEVVTAAIVEETAQNASPDTVTIRLCGLPENPRTNATTRLAYSLYAARTTEAFANGEDALVEKNGDTKPFEKSEKSTFEAPLSDLTDLEPVNYYRIRVHFIFDKSE